MRVWKCESVKISKISKKIKNLKKSKVTKKSNISKILKISKSILKSAVLPASLMPLFCVVHVPSQYSFDNHPLHCLFILVSSSLYTECSGHSYPPFLQHPPPHPLSPTSLKKWEFWTINAYFLCCAVCFRYSIEL